ncbi:MAG: hypothetical protein ACLRTC_14280 [Coprococcus sp.]
MGVKYRLKMKKWCSKWCSRQPVNPFTAGTLKEWGFTGGSGFSQ